MLWIQIKINRIRKTAKRILFSTGTFICVDQLMKAVDSKQTGEVDIFHTVYQLRRDRRYMVQTRAQYEFVYRYIICIYC
jgi:protein tyrosine phosphatase